MTTFCHKRCHRINCLLLRQYITNINIFNMWSKFLDSTLLLGSPASCSASRSCRVGYMRSIHTDHSSSSTCPGQGRPTSATSTATEPAHKIYVYWVFYCLVSWMYNNIFPHSTRPSFEVSISSNSCIAAPSRR